MTYVCLCVCLCVYVYVCVCVCVRVCAGQQIVLRARGFVHLQELWLGSHRRWTAAPTAVAMRLRYITSVYRLSVCLSVFFVVRLCSVCLVMGELTYGGVPGFTIHCS